MGCLLVIRKSMSTPWCTHHFDLPLLELSKGRVNLLGKLCKTRHTA